MKRLVLLLPLLLGACAELQKDFETRTCHYDGAYQAGVNHAQNSQNMNVDSIAMQCPQETQADVRKGYREGYTTSKRDAAPAQLAKALLGRSSDPKCQAQRGKEAHENFCGNLDRKTCDVHSGVCTWQ